MRFLRSARLWIALAGALIAIVALLQVTITGPRVTVRWRADVTAANRAAIERRYELSKGEPIEGTATGWRYELHDWSRDNIERLVRDPAAEDTGYIDRPTFTAEDPKVRISIRPWLAFTTQYVRTGVDVVRLSIIDVFRDSWRLLQSQSGWLLLVGGVMLWAARATTQGRHSARYAKGAMYLAISLWFCAPLLSKPLALGRSDWDQHLSYYGQVLKNVVEYGQAPFWNPWFCGGSVMWQNPQVPLLSPVFLLATFVPLQLAMKLNIVLHYWLGFIGVHLLSTRVMGLSFLPIVVFLATLFTASGAIALHLFEGHSNFLPVLYLPMMLFWLLSALRSRRIRDTLLAGSCLALMVWNGGPHVVPMALVSVGALVLVAAAVTRRWRPVILGCCVIVSGLAYAAPKLLPVSLFVTGERFEDGRIFLHPDMVPLRLVSRIYLSSGAEGWLNDPSFRWGWHEYGNYINPFSAVMVTAGVLWALWALWYRRTNERWLGLGLATATLLLFSLSLGEFADWSPASLAQRVPLLSQFRIPSRYTIPFVLLATTTLAWSLSKAGANALPSRRARLVVALLCLGSSAELVLVNRPLLGATFSQPSYDTSFQWMSSPSPLTTDAISRGSRGPDNLPMLWALVHDQPLFNCYEYLRLRATAIPDRPPVFSDGKSDVSVSRFLPNRIEFHARNGDEPSRVYLNTNGSPGWHTNAGVLEMPDDGAPFVTLAAGQAGTFAFWFAPEGLWLGVLAFAIATVVSIAAWRLRI